MRLRRCAVCCSSVVAVLLGGCGGPLEEADADAGLETEESSDVEPEEPTDTPPNAADEYERIYSAIGQEAARRLKDIETVEALTPSAVRELESVSSHLDEVVSASRMDHCDFGIRWEDGHDLPLYHLGTNRMLVQCLQADALRLGSAGDQDGAVERIESMLRLADHVAQDDLLIIKLVAIADLVATLDVVRELDANNLLDDAHRAVVVQMLRPFDHDNVLRVREGMVNEVEHTATALRINRFDPGFDYAFVMDLPQVQREAAASELERLVPQLRDAWNATLAPMELLEIAERHHDPLVKMFLTGFDSYRRQVDRSLRELRETIRSLAE